MEFEGQYEQPEGLPPWWKAWIPEWWWCFFLLLSFEVSFVWMFDQYYNLGTGTPTYMALVVIAFVFAPTFFAVEDLNPKEEFKPQIGSLSFVEITRRKFHRQQARLKAKKAEKMAARKKIQEGKGIKTE